MKAAFITTVVGSFILIASCGGSKKTSSSSGASEDKFHSRYLTPVIDGKMTEWGEELLYDNTTKFIYAVSNDATAIYIAIKAADRAQQMKIVQGGMEIWLDDKAKKKKSIGVKFPLGGGDMAMPAARNTGNAPDPNERRLQMKLKMLKMELTGFKEDINGLHDIYSNVQVKPVIDWDDQDNMIYEVAIPFAALDETAGANLNTISIGIFIKGVRMEQGGGGMPGGGRPAGGGPPPGGGGPPGGMRGGGGGMPDRSEMENMSKDNSFWTKYTIAKN